MTVNATDPMLGRLIDGRYQVRSRIARGGMATVYLATDLRLERRVAIKVMHGHLADDSQFKERFIQEARSAARLAHPNVVNVFDQGQDLDMAYLVMEYLPGITLRDLLQEHKLLTTEQTLDIMEAVLGGLAAAHKAGIVHRDLKPENVLLADDGRIKIGDFGLARAATANTASGAALLGTIAYLSPELVTRGIADTRSDIYAVGIMMYEMLTGEQPFKGEQPMQIAYQHANDSVPAPSIRNPRVPAELDELVLWATAREPDERPRDARAMLDQLLDTHNQLATALPTSSVATQRTMVLPAAVAPLESETAATQVLGSRQRAFTAELPERTTALSSASTKRRARGWWLFGVVVLIASIVASTAWYFGAGPGSRTSIPDSIAGMSVEEATATLQELGFVVSETTGETTDPIIAVGLVAQTDPPLGSSVAPGSTITLLVSTGPKLLPLPAFAGMTEDDARAAAGDFTVTDSIEQFSSDVAEGTVIDALGADGSSLSGVAQYGELQPITFIVSVGPLPDVSGRSVDDAIALLAQVGLTAVAGKEEFNNEIPEGAVIGIDPEPDANGTTRTFRVNDTVSLVISRGPDLVQVPLDIEDISLAAAKAALESLGFTVVVDTNIPPVFWDLPAAEVDKSDPEPGENILRGSTVTLTAYA